jgi:hypothetical protein
MFLGILEGSSLWFHRMFQWNFERLAIIKIIFIYYLLLLLLFFTENDLVHF